MPYAVAPMAPASPEDSGARPRVVVRLSAMDWSDRAVVLGARAQGEGSVTLSLLSRDHGRHKGLLRGARAGSRRGLNEPGTVVEAHWQARLADQLGQFRLEPVRSIVGYLIDDPLRLACLQASVSLVDATLPEREPHPHIHDALVALVEALADDDGWAPAHIALERVLLADSGFALDLERCAVTGETSGLSHVSPRTGRAVSTAVAAAYEGRLLVLPRLLGGLGRPESGAARDLVDALDLTGHFLARHLLDPVFLALPPARERYAERWRALAEATETVVD